MFGGNGFDLVLPVTVNLSSVLICLVIFTCDGIEPGSLAQVTDSQGNTYVDMYLSPGTGTGSSYGLNRGFFRADLTTPLAAGVDTITLTLNSGPPPYNASLQVLEYVTPGVEYFTQSGGYVPSGVDILTTMPGAFPVGADELLLGVAVNYSRILPPNPFATRAPTPAFTSLGGGTVGTLGHQGDLALDYGFTYQVYERITTAPDPAAIFQGTWPGANNSSTGWNYLDTSLAAWKPLDVRYWPANLQTRDSKYYRAEAPAGNLTVKRAPQPAPPYDMTAAVTTAGTDSRPSMVQDFQERLWLLFCREAPAGTFNVYECHSDADGEAGSWSTPTVAFTGGKACGQAINPHSGARLKAAIVGTALKGVWISTGGTTISEFTAVDAATSAALVLADDAFAIDYAHEGPERLIGVFHISGETAISDWQSGDEGQSWTRIT